MPSSTTPRAWGWLVAYRLTFPAVRHRPTDPETIVWEIVHPGDVLISNDIQKHTVQRGLRPPIDDFTEEGTYEFWGTYDPPGINLPDQETLVGLGIDFPRGRLSTSHVTFVKK